MLDYYSSMMMPTDKIYRYMFSRFPNNNESYIRSILDHMYDINYIPNDISVTGWNIFVQDEIESKVKERIQFDLGKAKKKLLLARCLSTRDDCCYDIMESISKNI